MIHAGLTGGIATGKTTVSNMLKNAGAVVIDADAIAHDATRKGMPAWYRIITHFGRGILAENGEIDRQRLGTLIFKNEKQKEALNRMVHPEVRKTIDEQLAGIDKLKHPPQLVILDIPLLIEVGWHRDLEEIILVYAPPEIQLKRLMKRDGLSKEDAGQRIRAQMPIDQKKAYATIIIDNQGDLEATRKKTESVFAFLIDKDQKNLTDRTAHR